MRQQIKCENCPQMISWNMYRMHGMCPNCQAADNVNKYGWDKGMLLSSHLKKFGMSEESVRQRINN